MSLFSSVKFSSGTFFRRFSIVLVLFLMRRAGENDIIYVEPYFVVVFCVDVCK